jgi:hypothetical protein
MADELEWVKERAPTTPCRACLHVSSVVDEQWVWLGQVVGMHGVSGTSQQATLNISDAKSFRLWNKDPACPPIHVKLIRDIHSVSLSLSLSLPLSLILHVLLQMKDFFLIHDFLYPRKCDQQMDTYFYNYHSYTDNTLSSSLLEVVLDKVWVKHWEYKSWITFKSLSLKMWKSYK